jgi:hypothetical protein
LREKKFPFPNKETFLTRIVDSSVSIHPSAESVACPPPWFGEVVLLVAHLQQHGVLAQLCERVQFARRRVGCYDVIDFVAVLFGYAISGERTLQAFYETLLPWAEAFMALFDRKALPSRWALSRFLAALTQAPVEALRTLFLDDLRETAHSRRPPTTQLTSKRVVWWIERETGGWS